MVEPVADFGRKYAGAFIAAANALRRAAEGPGYDFADCGLRVFPHTLYGAWQTLYGAWQTRMHTRRELVADLLEEVRALRDPRMVWQLADPKELAKTLVEIVERIELTPGALPIVLSTDRGHTLFLFNDSGLVTTAGELADSFLKTLGGDAEKGSG